MHPGYITVSGDRREFSDLSIAVGGERRSVIEGYITVSGERRQWFGGGVLLVGERSGSDTDSPFYIADPGDTALAFTQLAYSGPDIAATVAQQITSGIGGGRDLFYAFAQSRILRCTLSGTTVTAVAMTGTAFGSAVPTAAFRVGDDIYVADTLNRLSRFAPSGNTFTLTSFAVTGIGGTGGGVNHGDAAYIVGDNAGAIVIRRVESIVGTTLTLTTLTEDNTPAINIGGNNVEAAMSDGNYIYAWINESPATLYRISISGDEWSGETFGMAPVTSVRMGARLG